MIQFRKIGSKGDLLDTGLCDRNLNLLAHAQAIELDIGSRCGGHGVCGGDRVRISMPINDPPRQKSPRLSPLTAAEREHLSPDEIAQGYRLACQCFPEENTQHLVVEWDGGAGTAPNGT